MPVLSGPSRSAAQASSAGGPSGSSGQGSSPRALFQRHGLGLGLRSAGWVFLSGYPSVDDLAPSSFSILRVSSGEDVLPNSKHKRRRFEVRVKWRCLDRKSYMHVL
jgi:hypothetical protein